MALQDCLCDCKTEWVVHCRCAEAGKAGHLLVAPGRLQPCRGAASKRRWATCQVGSCWYPLPAAAADTMPCPQQLIAVATYVWHDCLCIVNTSRCSNVFVLQHSLRAANRPSCRESGEGAAAHHREGAHAALRVSTAHICQLAATS